MWLFQLDHVTSFLFSQVWKLGWSPKPGGDFGTVFPEIPVEFLQEKEVFKEFIYRINTLGTRAPPQARARDPAAAAGPSLRGPEGHRPVDAQPVARSAVCSELPRREARSQLTCVRGQPRVLAPQARLALARDLAVDSVKPHSVSVLSPLPSGGSDPLGSPMSLLVCVTSRSGQ